MILCAVRSSIQLVLAAEGIAGAYATVSCLRARYYFPVSLFSSRLLAQSSRVIMTR